MEKDKDLIFKETCAKYFGKGNYMRKCQLGVTYEEPISKNLL